MKACLLLGSNLGDRKALLSGARTIIERNCGTIMIASQVYETEPWGFEADTTFLNQALLIETMLLPLELLRKCLHIEDSLGRVRTSNIERYSSRNIDIDILFYEDVACQTRELTLPHPRLHLRRFALKPLAEVAPEWAHPVLGLNAVEIMRRLP